MIVLRDQMQSRGMAERSHGDGGADGGAAQRDFLFESPREALDQLRAGDEALASARAAHEA